MATFAAVVLSVLAIGALTELLSWAHLEEIRSYAARAPLTAGRWSRLEVAARDAPLLVQLDLDVVDRELRAKYAFNLAPASPLVYELQKGVSDRELVDFVFRYVGGVIVEDGGRHSEDDEVRGRSLEFEGANVTTRNDGSPATVVLRAKPLELGTTSQLWVGGPVGGLPPDGGEQPMLGADTVRVDAGPSGRVLTPYLSRPELQSPHDSTFVRTPGEDRTEPLRFELKLERARPPKGQVLQDYGNIVLPAALGTLAVGLIEILPLAVLLFHLAKWRSSLGGPGHTAFELTRVLVVFHVAVVASDFLLGLAFEVSSWVPAERMRTWDYLLPSGAGSFGCLLLLAALWPAALASSVRRDGSARSQPGARRRTAAVAGGFALVAVLIELVLVRPADLRTVPLAAGIVAGLVIALAVVTHLALGSTRSSTHVLLLAAGVLGLAFAAIAVPTARAYGGPWGRSLGTVALGVFAMTSCVTLAALLVQLVPRTRAANGAEDEASGRRPWWAAWAATLVVVVLMAPVMSLLLDNSEVHLWSVLNLASALDELIYLPVAVSLIAVLRWVSHEGLGLSEPAMVRDLGIAFLLVLVFSDFDRWFYLPLPLLLTWLLVTRVLLPPRLIETSGRVSTDGVKSLVEAEMASERLRALRQKYRAGDDPTETYEIEAGALERRIKRLRNQAQRHGDPFSLAPEPTRWAGGKRGAQAAFILSIPWMVLYLHQQLTVVESAGDYSVLRFVGSSPLFLFQWTILGFFLGYFFDLVVGGTGVEKAAWSFLVILTHGAFLTLLAYPDANWLALGFWALQTFVVLLLVGVFVGDLQVARRASMGWRDLVDAHNVRWVLAWGSSVLVAIGGLAITVLTTAATDLYTEVLKSDRPPITQPPPAANRPPAEP